jgi:hypothetical protein
MRVILTRIKTSQHNIVRDVRTINQREKWVSIVQQHVRVSTAKTGKCNLIFFTGN